MAKVAKQTNSVIWLQPDGPFTAAAPFQRGQAGMGDITLPGPGERTVFFGTGANGSAVPLGVEQGTPGTPTTTIENYVTFFRDSVQKMRQLGDCRNVQLRIHDCLSLDHAGGWAYMIHLGQGQVGDGTISAPASREFAGARIGQSHSFNPTYDVVWVRQALTALTTTETEDLNDVTFIFEPEGCDNCGNGYPGPDEIGFIACDAGSAATANILYTNDGGSTWTAMSTDPFASDEHTSHIVARFLNKTQFRIIVSRITTDGSNPAEIAYGDVTIGAEGTVTWTAANVGSTNGDVIEAAFWPKFNRLYVATAGDIYLSTDQGESFTSIYTGSNVINGFALDAQNDRVYAVGASNTILVEKGDSGTFEALTGPTGSDASTAVAVGNDGSLWLGNGISIFYTRNSLPNAAAQWASSKSFGTNHAVKKISLKGGERALGGDSQLIHALVNDGTGNEGDIWLTADGGAYWEEVTNLTNSGYNAAYFSPIDDNLAFIAGEDNGSTGVIHKLSPEGGV